MKLIAEKLGRSDKLDRLLYLRPDGTRTQSAMPRQGILPHDLLHWVVESALPLRWGFLGQVAAGADADYVMARVHDPDQAAVERVAQEAAQTEAVVEALQTQLWAGTFDLPSFLEGVRSACDGRGRPVLELGGCDARLELYERALQLQAQWQALAFHQSLELEFHPPPL
jgi:hypothetical protein